MNNQRKISAAIVAMAIGSWLMNCAPAEAQVWGYSPYSGTSNWLWMARSLGYPLNRFSNGYSPLYLGSNLLYPLTYFAGQGMYNRQRNMMYGTYNQDPNQYNQNGYTGQNSGYNGSNNQIYGMDQSVHAKWKAPHGPQDDQGQDQSSPPPTGQQSQDWLNEPMVTPQAVPGKGGAMPPTAPAISHVPPQGNPHQMFGNPSPTPRANEPLAEGLVHVLNDRFNGNVGDAMRDKDLRKYARSVGLIDSDKAATKIPPEKQDLIRAILADRNESASNKINAVRVLLKH